MPTFAGFSALASVVLLAAGVVVLFLIALARRSTQPVDAAGDEPGELPDAMPEATDSRRRVPPAYGIALGCFAAAATFGVLGVVQRSPGSVDQLVQRIHALEQRLDAAEVELETRAVAAAALAPKDVDRVSADAPRAPRRSTVENPAPIAPRTARLPSVETPAPVAPRTARLPSVETPAPVAPRTARLPSAETPAPVAPPTARLPSTETPAPVAPPAPEAAPPERAPSEASAPAAPPPPPPVVAAPVPPIAAAPVADRDTRRSPTPSAASTPPQRTLVEKVRGDWEAIKRAASEAGDDWVEGWRRLRRLFAN